MNTPTYYIDNGDENHAPKSKSFSPDQMRTMGLINPDEPKEAVFPFPEDFQQRIIGALIHDEIILEQTAPMIRPNYFRENAHRLMARIILDHWRKYGDSPDTTVVKSELKVSLQDDSSLDYHLAELKACFNAYEPGVVKRQYVIDKIRKFCDAQSIRRALNSSLPLIKSGKVEDAYQLIADSRLDTVGEEGSMLKIFDENFLEGESNEWLIEDFIGRGHVMLLAGPSKAGKLLFLQWAVQSLIYNKAFLGRSCSPPVPIVYCDYEMKRGYFLQWYKTLLGKGDPATTDKWFNYACQNGLNGQGILPSAMTAEWLRGTANALEAKYDQPGLFIIDTMRGAFGSGDGLSPTWENNANEVRKMLAPITAFAHDSNWAVIITHHTNKQGGVSGSTDFCGAVDHVCRFYRDIEANSNVCKVSLYGRYTKAMQDEVATFNGHGFDYQGTSGQFAKHRALGKTKIDRGELCRDMLGKMEVGKQYTTAQVKLLGDCGVNVMREVMTDYLAKCVDVTAGENNSQNWRRQKASEQRLDLVLAI